MTAHIAADPDVAWLAAAAVVAWWLHRRGRLRSLTRRAGRLVAAVAAVVLAATVSTSAVVVVVAVIGCLAIGGRHTRRHYRRQGELLRWFWQGYNKANRRSVRFRRHAVALPDDYARHMASSAWRRQRLRVLARDNYSCRACRSGYRLEGHHKAYTTPIGREPDSWVVTLCQPCHRVVSDLHTHRGYTIEAATDMVLRRAVHAA